MATLPPDNVGGTHTAVVSIGVMLFVTIILIELAGTSHLAAIGVGFMFIAVVAIAGMTHYQSLQSVSKYPAVP
jgi:hypothetical protein